MFADVPTTAQPDGLAYLAPVVSDAATQMAPPSATVDSGFCLICNTEVAGHMAAMPTADLRVIVIVTAADASRSSAEIATGRRKSSFCDLTPLDRPS